MKSFILCFLLFLITEAIAREVGETEITTEDGIEVFQDEKYYLLKKNVKIVSDGFTLTGDEIKIFFGKDLYDITIINASGNVGLVAPIYNINASGENLIFSQSNQEIHIIGEKSVLLSPDADMYSDGEIKVDNINGNFLIRGPKSSLKADDIYIEGESIDGVFSEVEDTKDIEVLNVNDNEIAFIMTSNTDMFAKNINYDRTTSLIELRNDVRIERDGEKITGDYGTLDTKTNSYKVKSNKKNKVKVIISNKNE